MGTFDVKDGCNCELILETSEGEIKAVGDTLVHAWIKYITPVESKCTDWSFVQERIAAIEKNNNDLLTTFLKCIWSPGNYIFWKKGHCATPCSDYLNSHPSPCQTVNQAKGRNLLDRPDYTFESIRRWFENQGASNNEKLFVPTGLNKVLERKSNQLSDLFGSWAGFVSYFKLEGSFVSEKRVIDLARTTPPENTDGGTPMKIVTFGDKDEFDKKRPGEPDKSKPKTADKLNEDYEIYLKNSICAIQNRNRALSCILNP